ncbi:seryl-tRNA synthetase [Fonticula alba]|uniref:serine--tRNA ligase n=1 Tax=Fonticula alba TaxID=691883 RepID=A0A058ZI87_FONAL|nr:seryl-tRNA synthetase [Fonticula alba]KCV73237.1 seryl-tRNA synthetase [Fonticula alba]|eukprot:XP_009492938.1 seryl-tRNA synthetase [Fonticula alba]
MLDINLLRADKGGNPELVKEWQRKRGKDVNEVDAIIELDTKWISLRYDVDQFNKQINAVQKKIGAAMKAKEACDELLEEKKSLEAQRADVTTNMNDTQTELNRRLKALGNMVHDTVPDSQTEDDNVMERFWPEELKEGTRREDFLFHFEVLERLDGYDPERGQKIAGHRGYFLKNWGVILNQALINYGIAFLRKRQYDILQTPFMMNQDIMAETAQLEEFDEALYKITGAGADKYLIATSEQPISAYHRGEWLEPKSLPLRYGGVSTCFRKEAGAHGKDTWGIFRVHQFEKVEQFIFCAPDKSWEMFDEMIGSAEEFYQSLEIPYRVVNIASGALNNAAAKKLDLEAWFPAFGAYRELVSCSNCTDYQSRNLEIRYGNKTMHGKDKVYVHCLNATLTATERTLCCLLENYQTPEGLRVPTVLQPFVGVDFIPYVKPLLKKRQLTELATAPAPTN